MAIFMLLYLLNSVYGYGSLMNEVLLHRAVSRLELCCQQTE